MNQLHWPEHPENAYVRTCQECGHTQIAKDPGLQKSDAWRNLKCRKCKSEAMDYGSLNTVLYEDDDE